MSFSKTPRKSGPERSALRALFGGASNCEEAHDYPQADKSISPAQAQQFARLPLQMEAGNLLEEVDILLSQGVSIDTIHLELLAPAARQLGTWWEQDECDFIDVTMGLWRLQEVLHELSARSSSRPKADSPSAGRALFLPMPGDQHFMGPEVLKDFFVRSGWHADVMTQPRRKQVLSALAAESFDLVGLTLSRDCPSAAVKNIIKAMRSISRNEHVRILVGGHMINQNPAVVAEVGADGTGADARAALEVAEALVLSAKVRAQTLI